MIVGVGIDLVEVARIEESLRTYGERFRQRVFTQVERDYCNALTNPAEHYAGRFAAKEAFLKAIGTGLANGLSWTEIGVESRNGKPMLQITGRAQQLLDDLGIDKTHVSLSHTSSLATAIVILEKLDPY